MAIVNSLIYENFNYCLLVWHFTTYESSKEIEKIQKHCLKIALSNYVSDYDIVLRKRPVYS